MFPCGGGGGGKKKKPKKKKPTPSQLHYEAPLRTVATVFPSVYVAVLATRFGEPIARLPRETQHPVNPDFDDREFEDIPKELRDLDDKMTGGEMEYRELMVGVAMAVRVSRRFVATALDRPLLLKLREQAPPQIRAPLFQCVGATQGVWVYGVDRDHIVALMADGGHYAMDSRDRDARFAEVVETLRRAIKTAPPPPPLGPAPPSPLAEPVPLAALFRAHDADLAAAAAAAAAAADAAAALGMPIPPAEPDEPKEPVVWESPCGMPVPPRRRSVWEGLKGAFSSKPRPSKDKAVDRFGDVWYLT